MNRVTVLFAISGISTGLAAAAVAVADSDRISDMVREGRCAAKDAELVKRIRKEVDAVVKSEKSNKSFEERAKQWLDQERKTARDVPTLNWIRAIDPWSLPKNFPLKPGFERCAGALGTYVESQTRDSLDAWRECLDLTFREEKPAEFSALLKCLSAN